MPMVLRVECYAGTKADERPLRFRSQAKDSRTFEVAEILGPCYGIGFRCFGLRADDGNTDILRPDEKEDEGGLGPCRQTRP